MTEAEWLACEDPADMLGFVEKATDRKLRLFAVACCRRVWDILLEDGRRAVETAERHADKQASKKELQRARETADESNEAAEPDDPRGWGWYPPSNALIAARFAAGDRDEMEQVPEYAALAAELNTEEANQCALLRDIFPFHPSTLEPSWLTSTVVTLAQGIYTDRAFDRLPILADALMDAGCDRADILDHCRGPGPHVRGCWVVDLVLGKQ